MKASSRIVAAVVAAAALAACNSNGATSLPSTSGQSPMALKAPVTDFRLVENGRPVSGTHVMPTRDGIGIFRPDRRGSANLKSHGGPVQVTPSIYVVFWGFSTDPSGEAARITAFYNAVGGSSWLNTVTQYYQPNPTTYITNPSGQLLGTWYDNTNAVPSKPTDAQVAAESVRLAQHFGVYNGNVSYVVATPHGHNTSGFKTQWCAYHSATSSNGSLIAYTNLPYMSDGGASCGENSVNGGSAGLLDGLTIVGGHELAETQTDPNASTGWLDSSGNEIGDKCAWINLQNTSFGSATYPTQPLWSNAVTGCVQ